jgi:hypothetical protein
MYLTLIQFWPEFYSIDRLYWHLPASVLLKWVQLTSSCSSQTDERGATTAKLTGDFLQNFGYRSSRITQAETLQWTYMNQLWNFSWDRFLESRHKLNQQKWIYGEAVYDGYVKPCVKWKSGRTDVNKESIVHRTGSKTLLCCWHNRKNAGA